MEKIQDNFLNTQEFKSIADVVLGGNFPWYYNDSVVKGEKIKNNFLWTHTFYLDNVISSSFFKHLEPLLEKICIKSLIRIKANAYINHGSEIEHLSHADYPWSHKVALYSLNTTNGYTLVEGKKIQGIANRLLQYDGSIPHASATCTDQNIRVNIVINYF